MTYSYLKKQLQRMIDEGKADIQNLENQIDKKEDHGLDCHAEYKQLFGLREDVQKLMATLALIKEEE